MTQEIQLLVEKAEGLLFDIIEDADKNDPSSILGQVKTLNDTVKILLKAQEKLLLNFKEGRG